MVVFGLQALMASIEAEMDPKRWGNEDPYQLLANARLIWGAQGYATPARRDSQLYGEAGLVRTSPSPYSPPASPDLRPGVPLR